MRSATDRRPAQRGDQRRAALLDSLDRLLQEQDRTASGLDSITIADISSRAGVTRSAFYFYFESKQIAVAALVDEVYDEAFAAAVRLSGDLSPEANIEATIRDLFDARDRHQHVFAALLDARATSAAVRDLWDRDRQSFVPAVAAVIEAERATGRAPEGGDPQALASVLLDLNDRMLERLTRGSGLEREALIEAVVTVWTRTIYGRTDL